MNILKSSFLFSCNLSNLKQYSIVINSDGNNGVINKRRYCFQ